MTPRFLRYWLFLSLVVLALAGCEEDVVAVIGTEYPFTVYGVLNPLADTNFVRVFPIASTLEQNPGLPLDAVVTSTDLQLGSTVQWQDSLITLANGEAGYLFWTTAPIGDNRAHQISVTRSDWRASHAFINVPAVLSPQIQPWPVPDPNNGFNTWPVQLSGSIPIVRSLEIEYQIYGGGCSNNVRLYTFPYLDRLSQLGQPRWLSLALRHDYFAVKDSLEEEGAFLSDYGVYLKTVTLRAVVTDAGWVPPGGSYDREVLIEPGVWNNVTNGFGFLGSGYAHQDSIPVPTDIRVAAGFRSEFQGPCQPPKE